MNVAELLTAARTCRRFKGNEEIGLKTLAELVAMARLAPSARNQQPLRYVLVSDPAARERLFGLITLGGALRPEQRASESQHPGGYIVIFAPTGLTPFGVMDVGIAAQTINLAACERGLACCIVGAFNKAGVSQFIPAPEELEPTLILVLGKPDEERRLCGLEKGGDPSYFRNADDVHMVPKRSLDELIIAKY